MLILFIIQLNSVENKKCVKQATHVLHYYLTNCVASKPLLCGPRNYPNLPHKREFFLRPTPPPPPPLWNFQLSSIWPLRSLPTPGISNPFCGGGGGEYGHFLEANICHQFMTFPAVYIVCHIGIALVIFCVIFQDRNC